jgi:hypothetical protein
MAHESTIWSGWVSGRFIVRSSILAHIWFSEYVDEKPVKVEARPPRGGASNMGKKNFFSLNEENRGDKRIGDTGRVSLMTTTTHVRAGSHF